MIDVKEYHELARESGAYSDIELDILDEALAFWSSGKSDPATLVELRDGKILAGFAMTRREDGSESSINVQAICLGPSYIGTGAIEGLMAKLEEEILRGTDSAILRVETSTTKSAAFGSEAFVRSGYSLIGHIQDFYAGGNDYFMYAKHLHKGAYEHEKAEGPKRRGP